MIKDVVTSLAIGGSRDVAADFALSVAGTFEAHLTGIAFTYEPLIPIADMSTIPSDVIDTLRFQSRNAAQSAVSRFNESCRGITVAAAASTIEATMEEAPEQFTAIARRFDLSVIAQPQPDKWAPSDPLIEATLFGSGRPVLVVPYIQRSPLKLDRVAVCWDGSRNAARAVGDALPWLTRAKWTEIVIVAGEPAKSDELPGADIAQHLARHGVKVEVNRVVATETDVANTILSHAADASIDLLVMGAYGHSRLREFILGGATRGILAAMTVPTLMSH
jgi:nucleotide-binding universal stress UspA family protein